MDELRHVKPPVFGAELHEIERCEIARGVIQEHILGAGVGRVNAVGIGARIPAVDRGVKLHARIAALPRRLRNLVHHLPRGQRFRATAVGDVLQTPVLPLRHRLHKLVGRTHGIVGILKLDGIPRRAVQRHVIAVCAQNPRLFLFFGF